MCIRDRQKTNEILNKEKESRMQTEKNFQNEVQAKKSTESQLNKEKEEK